MNRVAFFAQHNRPAVVLVPALLAAAALAFPFLIGLAAAVGVALALLALAVSLGVYRLLNRGPLDWDEPWPTPRLVISLAIGVVLVFLLIQAVPYGWDRTNPPVAAEPAWDSLRTRELTVRACFDCHSNEVEYPWYTRVAPVSWAVQLHVDAGRDQVNYSEWDRPQKEADESAETVIDGDMPPGYYTRFTHDDARLSDTERQELIEGLLATFGSDD